MKGINVLSLFDGMSCGQQALERIGVKVDNYFASEIDKYAIKVTMANYSNTIQLGSVVDVDGYKLPKVDLLIGGSPCQSFSFAGKRKGMSTKDEQEILTLEHYLELKSEGYEFEGQSYLFWEYMRLLNECKPTYFLLENVEMGEKWEKVLSKAIGVNGIHINSALVSAQNRKRIYWTNIGMQPSGLFGDLESIIQQPKDKGILLKDILETDVDEKYFLSEKFYNWLDKHSKKTNNEFKQTEGNRKAGCLSVSALKSVNLSADFIVHNTMPRSSTSGKGGTGPLSRADGKTYCLDTGNTNAVEIVAQRGRGEKGNIEQQLEARKDGKTNCLTSVQKDNLIRQLNPSTESGGNQPYQQNRVYDVNGISPALNTDGRSHAVDITSRIRRLTPIECERLQTVTDNYTAHVSDSQRYKMLGNGWTIDVIAHIFSYLPKEIINNL
jgi:DNA (cytosine-5)-methyltransferase 3A